MSKTKTKSKVTYSYEQRLVLLLKEAFIRDLIYFDKLLLNTPKDWTLTVIQDGDIKELVVNVPAKSNTRK
jgi:hypothetical protein